jgi:poly(A) polymerase
LIGRRFRLVHVFFGPQNIEVATFRKLGEEQAKDGDPLIRHDNTFGTPEEDAFRRDFTVNALFYDIRTFRVIDYVGGIEDLQSRIVRTIGDPEVRMREDPVRMIRAVRMSARFGLTLDAMTEAAILKCHDDVRKASTARLAEETYRTLGMSGAAGALPIMDKLGLLAPLLPVLTEYIQAVPEAMERTSRNLEALEQVLKAGAVADHALALATLFVDFYLSSARAREASFVQEFLTDLRNHGFARADTERMRLLLETLPLLLNPDRRTTRLTRRSYFGQIREFYELVGTAYGGNPALLKTCLDDSAQAPHSSVATPGPRRRRRHRRRKRTAAAGDLRKAVSTVKFPTASVNDTARPH